MLKFNNTINIQGIEETGGGTTINNEDKTITTNGTYTADTGYTGLGTVTVNVPDYVTSGLPYSFGTMTTTVTIEEG